jgi:hypothetical protein
MSNFCPICQREFKDILKHFTLEHEISDINQLKTATEMVEAQAQKWQVRKEYIREINEKLHEGEITIEEWRARRDRWDEEHK